MAGKIARSLEDSARAGFREPNARGMITSRDWDHVDYWYDRHLEVASPAAQTANPSGLALIAFAVTTILLQVSMCQATLQFPVITFCMRMHVITKAVSACCLEEVTHQQLCI